MKHFITIALLLSLTPFCAAAINLNFVPEAGKVEFKTKGWPSLVTIKGKSSGVKGTLMEKENKVSGTLSFDLKNLKTGIKLRDDHMKNKYLQVEKFPVAKLTLTELPVPKDFSGDFEFKGQLELHGETKEITGKAKLKDSSSNIEMSAEIPLKLSDFKIEIPSYKGITVAEKVTVKFETKVTKTQ